MKKTPKRHSSIPSGTTTNSITKRHCSTKSPVSVQKKTKRTSTVEVTPGPADKLRRNKKKDNAQEEQVMPPLPNPEECNNIGVSHDELFELKCHICV
jgi:hypothetical protein